MTERCEVAVIGGGPVGLLLAGRLAQAGIDVRVLERRTERSTESRAIGIHPPGLACLGDLGVADALMSHGVQVRKGLAFAGPRALGAISFDTLAPPHNFVLTVPQHHTEAVLERRLQTLKPGALATGVELERIAFTPDGVRLGLVCASGQRELDASFVVGCDGKHSAVRKAMNVSYQGGPYPARFIMGDVPDDSGFGAHAAVFLTRTGLVESFPLPEGRRRWVASTGTKREAADPELLARLIAQRTDQRIRANRCFMINTFTAEHFVAARMFRERAILAGDSAHVVSPIGGQGMNLGWLDAWALSRCLVDALRHGREPGPLLEHYERQRLAAARTAIRRAELFMMLGRGFAWPALRDTAVRALLSPVIAPHAARLFTMRGL
jgi:2-polyprenyl-6-methoxyphenol hydroxylase-like FAD-dependent oxidoreductase